MGFPRFVSRFDLRQLRQGQYPGAVIDFYIVRDTTTWQTCLITACVLTKTFTLSATPFPNFGHSRQVLARQRSATFQEMTVVWG